MLVEKAKECEGDANEVAVGFFESLELCAHACRGSSQMFIYGTTEHGFAKSNLGYCRHDDKCKCVCEKDTVNNTCKTLAHTAYNLYAFKNKGMLVLSDLTSGYCLNLLVGLFDSPSYF